MTTVLRFHCPAGDQEEEVFVVEGLENIDRARARVIAAAQEHMQKAHKIQSQAKDIQYAVEQVERPEPKR